MADEPAVEQPGSSPVAGASARSEFERRSEQDRERLRRARPAILAFGVAVALVGLLLTAFGPTLAGPIGSSFRVFYLIIFIAAVVMTPVAMFAPQRSTIAWRTGALGEERTGEVLRPLEAEGFRIIHDRLIPGSRANIDHIVVGPPGVFIVETKSYERRLSRGQKERFAAQARGEAAVVAGVISPFPVTPLVCVHRADLGWFKTEVDGVRIVTSRELVKLLRKAPAQLAPGEVGRLSDQIERTLVPAVGTGRGRTPD
ncbi:MAG: nuclease-related domain-containing protein [Candidatus Limnocylindrales bacterium]|jgi:hypothetical protein